MEVTLWNNHLPLELDLLPGPTQRERQEVVLMPHEFLITVWMLFVGTADTMLVSEELTDSDSFHGAHKLASL